MSKILIVEDNAESRYMLEQLLASKGHHIITAENGEDALRLARQDPPEVIISDIMMPVMNGFRLCREVKKDSSLRTIPFIFYTATFVDRADEKLAMSLGASRFIVKPTEGEHFIQILDEVLNEHRKGILPVPEGPQEGEDTLLEMYDNSIARKLAETVEKLQDERNALIKSEQRLKEAQELAQIGHWEFDLKSNSLECSDEIYRILGLKPQEFDATYEAFMAFVHPDDRAFVTKARKESLEKKTQYDIECRALLKDGTIKYVNERFQTIYDDDGMPTCSMGTVQDITERKQAEERLHHLNLVLHAIREVNQLIVKEKDRDTLLHKTCEILIKTRGYYNAWIALLDEEGKYITSAEAGLDKDFAQMKKLLKEGKWPACAKKALNQKELVITEEPKTECMGCPLSVNYADRGAYTICLAHNGRNYGVLSVSVPELSIGDKQEHGLLREAAGDIAFALYSIEVEKEGKKAEEALQESEKRYRSLVETSLDVIFTLSTDGTFSSLNPAFEKITGLSRAEWLGKSFARIVHPDDLPLAMEIFQSILQGETPPIFELRVLSKSGEYIVGQFTATPQIQDGKVFGLLGIGRDITERKEAEKALKEANDIISKSSSVAFTWKNQEGWPVEFVSENVERIFGYTAEEFMTGKANYADCVHPEDLQRVAKEVAKYSSKEETAEFIHEPYRIIAKDGSEKIINDWTYIVRDSDGRITHYKGIVEDITDRKREEEEREKLQSQLQQAQKMEAIGTLAGGIAHDFNNILGAIIGYTEIADLQVPEGNKAKESLKEVLKAGLRARDLVKQILAFSRKGKQERIPLQIGPIVKEALKLLMSSLPTTIEIRQNIESDTGIVEADPTQIHQILMNLCTNASHAMREQGGILEVGIRNVEVGSWDSEFGQFDIPPGTYLRLSVSDTGQGMTPEVLERIFEPYFTTKEKGEGTGLGLSVVHGIVKNYGGTITAYSEPGMGSTFHVYLPVIQKKAEVPEIDEVAPIPTGNEHILFIDDEPALVEIGKQMLEWLGYEVTTRTSSMEALELFKAKPDQFDLVITDMTMPHLTGERLAGELMNIRPDIPVIICTGFSERISEEKAKVMGIKSFVMKPLVMRYLAHAVRKVLD